jgi:hypothetical protein
MMLSRKFWVRPSLAADASRRLELAEVHERDRQAGKCQREKETEPDAGALPHHGVQKRRDRDVDHECADDVVETPLHLVGLQCVVTANATLFVRHGGIDGAEHPFAIDVEQLGNRFWIWRCREGLDGSGHLGVRWRRQDLASGATDRGQAKLGIVAVLLVEGLDGMGSERRRNRCACSELRSDGRIVGDKGVHQLQRDDLFAALVLLEPVQAEIVESVADRHRQHGAQAKMQQKAATGSRPHEAPDWRKLTHPVYSRFVEGRSDKCLKEA